MSDKETIVVTGAGIVSALGCGTDATLDALLHGASGIAPIRYLQTMHSHYPAGEVKMDEAELCKRLSIPAGQTVTRTALLGMTALGQALDAARLTRHGNRRTAFVSGTTVGGMDKSEQYYNEFLTGNSRNEYIAAHDCGACTEMIADHFGGFDMVTTISTACSSAANALIFGAELLRNRRADIVVAGGSECISKFHLNGFKSLMILDGQPCRPFDRDRAGLNLGEGAAYMVLETAASASHRGVAPLCILSGYANTCDAYHQTASSPNGEGAYLAMKQALASAGLQPGDIDYINAHGTGTPNNDLSEGHAIMRIFGNTPPPVSSTKPFTGHTTSAAGSVEAVIALLCLQHGIIPANLNYTNKMDELTFEPVKTLRQQPLKHVLSNSFGFGGNDTALVWSVERGG